MIATIWRMRRGYFLGAFHLVVSNIIVMNKAPIKIASRSKDERVYNAYCFHMFIHEYLHALGYLDKEEARDLVHEVCSLTLDRDHPATVMTERGITFYFPKVTTSHMRYRFPRTSALHS